MHQYIHISYYEMKHDTFWSGFIFSNNNYFISKFCLEFQFKVLNDARICVGILVPSSLLY